MKMKAILTVLSLFALMAFPSLGNEPTGTPLPITDIEIGGGSVNLTWDEPFTMMSEGAQYKLYEAPTVTGLWTEVTDNVTKDFGSFTVLVGEAPMKFFRLFEDVVQLMRDTGMRNRRELYRVRIENINWQTRSIFLPDSKTPEGRRTVPMSERVYEILRRRSRGLPGCREEGRVGVPGPAEEHESSLFDLNHQTFRGSTGKGRPAERAGALLRAPRFWNRD